MRNFDSSSSNNIQMIVDAAGTGYQGLILAIDQYGKFYIQADTGTSTMKAVSTTTAQKDTWYHVTGRWTLSGVMIYINGVKEGTATGSNQISFTQSPVVGRQASADIRYLDGLIDDFRISNLARTDSAILESYTQNKPSGIDANTTYKLNFDQSLNPVYQPTSWTPSGGRLNQVEYDPTAPYGGSHVLHIDPGTATNASQITDFIALNGVDQFIISSDIKVKGSGNDGVRLQVNWYDSLEKGRKEIGQDRVFALTEEKDWQRYSMVLNPPTGAVYARVLPIVYNGFEGYFDNLQFEKSSQVREYNALENSSFERDLAQWSRSDNSTSVTTEDKYSGGKSLKIQRSSTSGTSYAESLTIIPVKKGQVYTVSGLLKTVDFNSVGTDDGARIRIYHSSNSGGLKEFDPTKLVKTNSDWTKYVQTLTPDQDGFLKIRLEMKNSSGKAFFDNLRLSYGNQITEYGYDINENYVTQVKNQLGEVITYENDGYGQVKKVITPKNQGTSTGTSYSYDGLHRLNNVTPSGNLPKWLSGTLTVISGISQVVAGAALGAAVGWTGVGAVAAGALIVNGTATVYSGGAQIYNGLTNGNSVPEENPVRTLITEAGRAIGGNKGKEIGTNAYDAFDIAATAYSIVGGGATAFSKTANFLGQAGKVEKVAYPAVKSAFLNEYKISSANGAIRSSYSFQNLGLGQ